MSSPRTGTARSRREKLAKLLKRESSFIRRRNKGFAIIRGVIVNMSVAVTKIESPNVWTNRTWTKAVRLVPLHE